MNEKTGSSLCPKCGAVIPAEASQGLCPKCALAAVAALTETGVGSPWPAGVPSIEVVQAAFPQLEIVELIGAGGMGAVFKARQPKLDRFVALKVLSPSLAASPAFAERFNREAKVLARLNHPGIVNVFDFGAVEPSPSRPAVVQASSLLSGSGTSSNAASPLYFLLMEYVDGVNLRQAMAAGRFTPGQALALVPKICEALQFAHDEGILHRDIKPENILLDTRGRLKIADFGIAKLVGEPTAHTRLTATGAAVGTPQYMAPEQLERPGDVDQRADIYSLGVVFYEMLTGELPIGRFAPPSAKAPVDARVDEVVFRALEKERERRYGSAGEVKTSVEHLTQAPAASPAVATPAFDPAKDYILCPPQLPRMAQAIIVYALVVAPMLWVLDLFALSPLPDHPAVGFAQAMVNLFLSVGLFPLLVVLWIGGWKLRGLRRSAVTWLKTAIWLRFAGGLLAGLGQVWVEVLAAQLLPDDPGTRPPLSEGLYIALALAALAFEISALAWLHRHTALVKALCPVPSSSPTGGTTPAPRPVLEPAPRWSGKAVAAACLAAPAWLGAIGLLIVSLWVAVVAATNRNMQFGGPVGLAETAVIVVLLGLPGIAGLVLGAMALSELRAVPSEQRGAGFALVGVGGLPTVLFQLLLIAAVAVPLSLLSPDAPQRVVPLAMSIGPVAGMFAGLALIRLVMRRTVGPGSGRVERGRPWLNSAGTVGLLLGAILVVVLVLGFGLGKGLRGQPSSAEIAATLRLYPNQAPPLSPEAFNVKALAPPRENLIVAATVFSNNVPVSGRELRAKLWPASSLKPSSYNIRWQALAEPAAAPWEVVVEESWTGTIAARLRLEGLPLLDWVAAPQAAKAVVKQVSREAQALEIARALQDVGGGNRGAADWSVRLQLQSQPPQPSTSQRGIEADFVLPADQVAVFEVVTRTNRQVIAVPGLAAYLVNGASESCEGTFLWHDDPEDLDSLTALPRWSFGLVVDGGRSVATGLGVPTPPANYAGSVSLWTQLEPDTERIEGLSESDAGPGQPPSYGLRVRTQTFRSKPGLNYQGAGFGTNWLAEAATRLAAPAP